MTFKSSLPTLGLAGVVAMAAMAGPAVADGVNPVPTFIPVPTGAANHQPNGAFTSFDISFADPVTGNIFIADRSNASVDIFSGSSLSFLGRAEGFTGQTGNNNTSGADGVLTVTSGGVTTLYAGDGDSLLRVYNATNPAAPTFQQSISTGGTTRVDEMAFSPSTGQVLAANNAETPAFGNLFSTTNGGPPVTLTPALRITVPAGQGGSREAAWSSRRGIRKPQQWGGPRSGFLFRSWPGQITQVGSPRSALLALCCKPKISGPCPASHRRGARRPDSPLAGAATC